MKRFHFLHYGLAAVLVFVGGKMMLAQFYKIPTPVSLLVIAGVLAASVAASLWFSHTNPPRRNLPSPVPRAEHPE